MRDEGANLTRLRNPEDAKQNWASFSASTSMSKSGLPPKYKTTAMGGLLVMRKAPRTEKW
jgi:hypothetical protein